MWKVKRDTDLGVRQADLGVSAKDFVLQMWGTLRRLSYEEKRIAANRDSRVQFHPLPPQDDFLFTMRFSGNVYGAGV